MHPALDTLFHVPLLHVGTPFFFAAVLQLFTALTSEVHTLSSPIAARHDLRRYLAYAALLQATHTQVEG